MNVPSSGPIHPLRPRFSLARLTRLARKELSESLRDRRTLLTLVLMPLLLYPLLGLIFLVYFRSPLLAAPRSVYRVGYRTPEEWRLITRELTRGEKVLLRDQGFVDFPDSPTNPVHKLEPHVEVLPTLKPFESDDPEEDVRTGKVDVGLRLLNVTGQGRPRTEENHSSDWDLFYLENSATGRAAVQYLQRVLSASAVEHLGGRLRAIQGPQQRVPPVFVQPRPLTNPQEQRYSLLGALLPLILVLMTITGAVYPAIDLTAGERERGTLEILMAAPVPRLSILLAKYVTVLTVALLTALINLGMMTATFLVLGIGPGLLNTGPRLIVVLVEVLGLLLLLAAFFSAVLLTLTSLARSFKEAQAYLIPLMLVALTPGMLSLLPDLKLQGAYLWVPLLNIVLLSRDLLDGVARPLAAGMVVLITALYAVLALVVAARIFGQSAVPTGEEGWLSRLFYRQR